MAQLPGERRNNKKKVKRKSVFTLFPWFQLQTKKLPKLACIHDTYEYTHTYTTCAWYVWYMAFEVRLGRAGACLRLFIATLFRAYKYYFRPSWSAHAMGRQLSGFMIWPQHTHKRVYILYIHMCTFPVHTSVINNIRPVQGLAWNFCTTAKLNITFLCCPCTVVPHKKVAHYLPQGLCWTRQTDKGTDRETERQWDNP